MATLDAASSCSIDLIVLAPNRSVRMSSSRTSENSKALTVASGCLRAPQLRRERERVGLGAARFDGATVAFAIFLVLDESSHVIEGSTELRATGVMLRSV
jgi:hypothetical protein